MNIIEATRKALDEGRGYSLRRLGDLRLRKDDHGLLILCAL